MNTISPIQQAVQQLRRKPSLSVSDLMQSAQNQQAQYQQYSPSSQVHSMALQQATQVNQDARDPSAVSGEHDFDGLCQKYVEQATYGKSGIYPTAIAAFKDYADKGQAFNDMRSAQPGDLVYYAPDKSNMGCGHVGIYAGDGKMVSATYNGIRQDAISSWTKSTGQSVMGFVKP